MAEKNLAEWVDLAGKKYVTNDPEVVRRRRACGFDDWTVAPPAEVIRPDDMRDFPFPDDGEDFEGRF